MVDSVWIVQVFHTNDGINELSVGTSREAALAGARVKLEEYDDKKIADDFVFLTSYWRKMNREVVVGCWTVRKGTAVDAMREAVVDD